ncbi:NADH-quinone oxidoreductase [Pyrrhoderma noxium]|uniref:NADH-quinone oxidoreductase n=1 Tax=Pyrrhoderma noxium TaxID=2282107 RepID=A0A286UL99_9AGAM|nr:NADH-quinone oxidoreductase [Pyrrhoderma noxium]
MGLEMRERCVVWGFVVQMRKAVPTRARDTDGCLPSRGDSVPMGRRPKKTRQNFEDPQPASKQSTTSQEKSPKLDPPNMAPKVAIVIYSMYGHIAKVAEHVKKGVESAGGSAQIFQIPETLSEDILKLLHAPAKPNYPVIAPNDLVNYDAFLFGIPTRYGNFPGQWKAFWDATGGLWAQGALHGKYAGVFVSTGTPGGGQEVTISNSISTLVHHGIIFVPLGYKNAFAKLTNLDVVHGGSPWGAGAFAAADGSRQPNELELEIAEIHGKTFYETVSKVAF